MWEPRRSTTLWASMACYTESFTFFRLLFQMFGLTHVVMPCRVEVEIFNYPWWSIKVCLRLFYVCVVVCRSCDELITPPRTSIDCPRLRDWSETESFMDAPCSSRSQHGNKRAKRKYAILCMQNTRICCNSKKAHLWNILSTDRV
jgi:hypothetical protein